MTTETETIKFILRRIEQQYLYIQDKYVVYKLLEDLPHNASVDGTPIKEKRKRLIEVLESAVGVLNNLVELLNKSLQ